MASQFHVDPPPGFRGLNPYAPVTSYTRHLPHWRQDGATYFVTFRLRDSLPKQKIEELKRLKKEWQRKYEENESQRTEEEKQAAWEELARTTYERSERWLDQGMGSCVLRDPENRKHLADALAFFDEKQYELGCYVVMPNHVHLVLRPFSGFELETILQGRKRAISRQINLRSRSRGSLWQEESYDRIIRDREHLWRCIQYIGNNPRNANLPPSHYTRWIRPDWQKLNWDFISPPD